jgi:hypothetical protein
MEITTNNPNKQGFFERRPGLTSVGSPPEQPPAGGHHHMCVAWSVAMRRSLCVCGALAESELRLALWLVWLTYDQDGLVGEVDFAAWARELGYGDNKGLRPDKCRAVFVSLVKLRIVCWNRVGATGTGPNGTFELLPAAGNWAIDGVRSLTGAAAAGTAELPFCAKRELDEALSSVSRSSAVTSGPSADHRTLQRPPQGRPAPDWAGILKTAIDDPAEADRMLEELRSQSKPSAESAEGCRRNNPPTSAKSADGVSADYSADAQSPPAQGVKPSADYSAETQLVTSLALVPEAKLVKTASADSAESRSKPEVATEPTPAMALEFFRKVDRKRTLNGRFFPGYDALTKRKPAYVMGRLKSCFEDHELRFGDGPQRLSDPVGWMGRIAAVEGYMKWFGKLR